MSLVESRQHMLLRKISRRKEEIRASLATNIVPITDIGLWETPEFLKFDEAMAKAEFKPVKVGDLWGGGVNGWFRIRFQIPSEMKGRQVAAYMNLGGEGCAFIDGKAHQGVDCNHEELLLTLEAEGGESFEIFVDAMSHIWHSPHDKTPRKLQRAELGTRNPELEELYFNLEVLSELGWKLPADSPRRNKIVYLLNKCVDAFDYSDKSDESLKASAIRCNDMLKPLLDMPAVPSATNVAVHGHAHIDTAWLWPYRETMRKCARTFSSVMRNMEHYPEYIFSQSQPQLYEFTRDRYPELFEQIKQRVKEGRWDVTGSMWVESDCNVTSGESLVRQLLVGKNYFMDEFGVETDVLWLPDVFGYSAALPQILQKARVPYFSTIKINWSQFNKFPYNTFYWKGIDGTRVLAHFPPTTDYNAFPDVNKLHTQVNEFKEKDRSDWSLLSYGWGDGGGGPDRRHLELLRRAENLEGLPRCKQMHVSEFFKTIDDGTDYPEWVGELYLELHRGTYTTQGRNKRFNRQCELQYRDAEFLASVAMPLGYSYPYQDLHKQWRNILCHQFHDVIPGSSIRLVYEDTDKMYPEILAVSDKVKSEALGALVQQIDTSGEGQAVVVYNTLPWNREDLVTVALDGSGKSVKGLDGSEVPCQAGDGTLTFKASVPSMGYAVYRVEESPAASEANDLIITENLLENRYYRVALDADGCISSLVHKATGREVVTPEGKLNTLRLYEDKPLDWAAWDIDFFYDTKWEDITQVDSIGVMESGPLSGTLEVLRSFGKSRIKQSIVLYADNPRIDFKTWVDWHEENKCLKAVFPVDVNATKARYEIQFGNVERHTHENTSWDLAKFEVVAHKWADISEEGFGVSLMNDCKYGHHVDGTEMRLSLLRAPKEPDEAADMGEHEFTYSLMPHEGTYVEADTVKLAYALNVPMQASVVDSHSGNLPASHSFFSVDAPNVILETVKKAEKEDTIIVRLYECHNKRATVKLNTSLPVRAAYECDLMEDNLHEVAFSDGHIHFEMKPFEIRTFKLVI